ncbi:MAG: DUF4437 domain-containing protein [Bacteroidetes bacterium]|nr:MAG: DUF4437 domain-containing protein [Bacteroidota bacterium]
MRSILFFALLGILTACTDTKVTSENPTESNGQSSYELVLASEVNWEKLNPARGDKSPQAGTLWGDRKGSVPTGFLVKFVDGFSSPPHIHNVSYRGVVINGLIHNDDPDAADMWMPAGSFWTQPKGENHITAAKGETNIAYIEIEAGPYLVLPTEEAFDSGERPVNVDASNIVWIDQPGISTATKGAQVAYLWGEPQGNQLYGTLIKMPAGFKGKIQSVGSSFKAVVIQGEPQYFLKDVSEVKTMEPGSYFSSAGKSAHHLSSDPGMESIIYVRTDGNFDILSSQ